MQQYVRWRGARGWEHGWLCKKWRTSGTACKIHVARTGNETDSDSSRLEIALSIAGNILIYDYNSQKWCESDVFHTVLKGKSSEVKVNMLMLPRNPAMHVEIVAPAMVYRRYYEVYFTDMLFSALYLRHHLDYCLRDEKEILPELGNLNLSNYGVLPPHQCKSINEPNKATLKLLAALLPMYENKLSQSFSRVPKALCNKEPNIGLVDDSTETHLP